jgi:hypothetical protein
VGAADHARRGQALRLQLGRRRPPHGRELAGERHCPACVGGAACTPADPAGLFANPVTDAARSSSVSVLDLGGGRTGAVSLARPIDGIDVVGGTHPSALALATRSGRLYVADATSATTPC